jgi:spore coat polysaccharide biosynthesis protein SpsF (cytidylyltransferase family)
MIIAFVPCRLKSSRLPNKATADINGVSSIERCLLNTTNIQLVDKVVLATSTNAEDDVLENHTLGGKVELVRGSEEDVLERFIPVIDKYNPEFIMRVTGDCPTVSYELADILIRSHIESGADVTLTKSKVPLGINSEVYSTSAIRKLRELFPVTNSSEYLIYYFLNNPTIFKINMVEAPPEYIHNWRLTLDESNDLELFQLLFEDLCIGKDPISFRSIVEFFKRNPESSLINLSNEIKYKNSAKLVEFLTADTTYVEP